jgi:hypothetical protein
MHLKLKLAFTATAVLIVWAGTARAQSNVDPTRPPAFMPPGAQSGAAQSEEVAPESIPAARIIVGGASRRFVVVDGHMVRVGETYRQAKLVDVNREGAVWLRKGVYELDHGGGRISKVSPGAVGVRSAKPASRKAQDNSIPGGSTR